MHIEVLHQYNSARYSNNQLNSASLRDRIMAQLIDGIILGICIGLLLVVYSKGKLFSLWISPLVPVYLVQTVPGYLPDPSNWWWGGYYVAVSLPVLADVQLSYPSALQWLFYGLYYGIFHTLYGQTPGKMMKGLVVLTGAGQIPSLRQSVLRWLSYVISFLPLGLGFWLSALHPRKQTWHDRLSDTEVLKFLDYNN